MRIALVSEPYYPDLGGMPEHVHNLGIQLVRRGHEVTLYTTAYPQAPALAPLQTPYRVVRLGRATSHIVSNGSQHHVAIGLRLRAQLAGHFAQQQPDVIHLHGPIFPTLALLAMHCAPPTSRLVGTLHTHFDDSRILRLFRRPLQRYLNALDGMIAVSDSALRSLLRVGFSCRATRIENGVDLDYWGGGAPVAAYRDGRFNVLVQTRLEPRNDVATLIDAMRRLPDPQSVRLLVVGSGPQKERLATQAAGLDVHFLGPQLAARADLAASCDAYFFAATIASHPMSLLEGMAAARPILAYDIEGVRELVSPGQQGVVVAPGDAAALSRALATLRADPALRGRMGQAARRQTEAFGWEAISARVLTFYQQVLAGNEAGWGEETGAPTQ